MSTTSSVDVLVVEDDADIRLALEEFLADEGYSVELAADGALALGLLRRHGVTQPKLVLLDLMMPRMNGWELAEAMRSDARLRDIPLLVMSAGESNAHPALKGLPFIPKPIDTTKLLEHLERSCRKTAQPRASDPLRSDSPRTSDPLQSDSPRVSNPVQPASPPRASNPVQPVSPPRASSPVQPASSPRASDPLQTAQPRRKNRRVST